MLNARPVNFGPTIDVAGHLRLDFSRPGDNLLVKDNGTQAVVTLSKGAARIALSTTAKAAGIILAYTSRFPVTIGASTAPPDPGDAISAVNWDVRLLIKYISGDSDWVFEIHGLATDTGNADVDNFPYQDVECLVQFNKSGLFRMGQRINGGFTQIATNAASARIPGDILYVRFVKRGKSLIAETLNYRLAETRRITGTVIEPPAVTRGVIFLGRMQVGAGEIPHTTDILALEARYSG